MARMREQQVKRSKHADPKWRNSFARKEAASHKPQAEARPNASEGSFRAIFGRATEGILFEDTAGGRFYMGNEDICQMLGYTNNELKGMGLLDIYPLENSAHVSEQFDRQSRGELTTARDIPVKRKDGSVLYADIDSTPVSFNGVTYVARKFRDVTERRRLEAAPQRVAGEQPGVLESIGDMLIVTDADLNIANVNAAAARSLGYELGEELKGSSATGHVAERDRNRVALHMGKVLTGQSSGGITEYAVVTRDGGELDVEASTEALRDSQGEAMGLIVTARDVTERKRLHEAVQGSEEKLRTTIESMDDGVTIVDAFGNITDVNRAVVSMLGYTSKEELIGKPVIDSIATRDQGTVAEEIAQAVLEGRALRTLEYTLMAVDGREVQVESSSTALYDGQGNLTGFVSVARDITQRKQMEEELEESARKLRAVIESIGDMLFITDMELNLVDMNEMAARLLGFDAKEKLIGTDIMECIATDDRNRFAVDMAKALARRPIEDIQEYTLVTLDGAEYNVETNTEVLLDFAGMPVGLVIIARDVTERRLMQEALRLSEEKLRTMFESMRDGVVLTNVDGRIVDVNEAAVRMYGYADKEGLIGRKGIELVSDKDRDRVLEAAVKQSEGENPLDLCETHTLVRADGSEFESESSRSVLRDPDGKVLGFIAVERDVTERKLMQDQLQRTLEELKRSNTELEQFAYVASHDLQEPLRMVSSYLKLLEQRYKDTIEAEAKEFIDYAVDGAGRMQGLIEALLVYSRVSTRGKPPEPASCETILEEAMTNLQVAIAESGAQVTHDPLPIIMADGVQMGQLFQNLIGNGIKFHKEGQTPQVHVSVEDVGDKWVFSFRDNGIGIAPEYKERIFAIFQRLHSQAEYAGTGIGLAVCKRIVERHRGRMWVESDLGQGATFKFIVPKQVEEPEAGLGQVEGPEAGPKQVGEPEAGPKQVEEPEVGPQ